MLPGYIRERLTRYKNAKAALEAEQSAPVKPLQIASKAGLTVQQAAEVQTLLYQLHTVSLDTPLTDADDLTVGDLIADDADVAGAVCDEAEQAYNRAVLHEAMQRDLDEPERILLQRFYAGEKLKALADEMGLEYSRANAMHGKALAKLRKDMKLRGEYMRSCDLYYYSYQRFRNSGLSSVEFIAERNERLNEGA